MRNTRILVIAITLVIGVVAMITSVSQPPPTVVAIGKPAPEFNRPLTTGEIFTLSLNNTPVLLSFLDVNTSGGGQTPDPSRSQIVVLQSMAVQHAGSGLRVLIAHANSGRSAPTLADLTNFSFNWHLDNVSVLSDDGALAHVYGVSQVPTTFLIASDGTLLQRWEGFTASQTIDLTLKQSSQSSGITW